MTWPTLATPLPWFAFTGSPTTEDELGNVKSTWADAVMRSVQGWDLLSSESLPAHLTQEKFEVFLMTPPDFWPGILDRIALPLPSNGFVAPRVMLNPDGSLAEGLFDVVGHDVEDNNFMSWHPGNIILLKRAEG